MSQAGCERGQLLGGGGVEDFQVDRLVAVDYPVSQPDRLLPGYAGEPVLDLIGELSGSLAEHGEIPQQGVAALAVGVQLADRDICVSWWACSAASIISVSRRMSRCTDGPGFS